MKLVLATFLFLFTAGLFPCTSYGQDARNRIDVGSTKTNSEAIMVGGHLYEENGTEKAFIAQSLTFKRDPLHSYIEPGEYSIEMRNAADTLILKIPFKPIPLEPNIMNVEPESRDVFPSHASFGSIVPYPHEVVKILIKAPDGAVLATEDPIQNNMYVPIPPYVHNKCFKNNPGQKIQILLTDERELDALLAASEFREALKKMDTVHKHTKNFLKDRCGDAGHTKEAYLWRIEDSISRLKLRIARN